jgi:ferrous iron transport protein B
MSNPKIIGLFGNPNTGKSSLYNKLTSSEQKVGNFPGITVDIARTIIEIKNQSVECLDFPGCYSIYPKSLEEKLVYDVLSNTDHPSFPDIFVVLVDASNIKRNLLLFSQLYDLGYPIVLALNMNDIAKRRNLEIYPETLEKHFPRAHIVHINARIGLGLEQLKESIDSAFKEKKSQSKITLLQLNEKALQDMDTLERFSLIEDFLPTLEKEHTTPKTKSTAIDKVLLHPILGYFTFFAVMVLVFQSVFVLASYPMDLIDYAFSWLSETLKVVFPEGPFFALITDGILPGLSGLLIFIPQIALLFFLISILEESGYLARIAFLMDRIMRPFGLSGKSVIPLISSAACAIPGIMSTRVISSRKERLTTILVAPLMACSARIPVYALIISLVIPNILVWGGLKLQGLVMAGLYFLGIAMSLFVALIIKLIMKNDKEPSVFILELPSYRFPLWTNVFKNVWRKVKDFVLETGKIILAISVLLWALASYGPSEKMNALELKFKHSKDPRKTELLASEKLENSYMGILGKSIEPIIKPLGFDWKIGISLITSFAAREVFVSSMSTIYATSGSQSNRGLIQKLRNEKHSDGKPIYSLACGLALLIFYAFALQCMATLAIVKKEMKSWKWPLIQFVYMGILAYFGAWITNIIAS